MGVTKRRKLKLAGILIFVVAIILLLAGCNAAPASMDTPTVLKASATGMHTAEAAWEEVENATGYLVAISELPDIQVETGKSSGAVDSNVQQASHISPASSSQDGDTKPALETFQQSTEEPRITFDELKTGTKYYITVASVYQDDNQRVVSKQAVPVILETDIPKVGAVSNPVVTVLDDTSLKITWDPYEETQTGADGAAAEVTYTLYTSGTENGEYEVLTGQLTDTAYTHGNLPEQTTRYYRIAVTILLDGSRFSGEPTASPVSGTTEKAPEPVPFTADPQDSENGNDVPENTGDTGFSPDPGDAGNTSAAGKQDQARAVARQIANSIGEGSDLERVARAAAIVSGYCSQGTYTTEGSDYSEAYGVFIAGEYSCAGATRALGMVLECMGYQWEHVNPNQWTHQWCKMQMDGQVGWAGRLGRWPAGNGWLWGTPGCRSLTG